MNRRHFLTTGAAACVAGCATVPRETFSYRLKVVLDDNGQERSGSSVIKVEWSNHSGEPMRYSGNYDSRVWGEAPIVDLGKRGLLFAFLGSNLFDAPIRFSASLTPMARLCAKDGAWDPRAAYNFEPDFWSAVKNVRNKTGEHDLWQNQLPQMARFEDLTKPSGVVEVLPEQMSEIYGNGVSLRRVSIEVTDAPPTERILDILPWLPTTEFFVATKQIGRTSSFAERTRNSHFRMWGR